MATTAYLITLSGMGDHNWKLLDAEAWAYLEAVDDWDGASPLPDVPPGVLAGLDDPEDAEDLIPAPQSSSFGNDVALAIPGSLFGGERFDTFDTSVHALNAFVARHGLTLVEAYDGYIY